MKILVTGSLGVVGSTLVRELRGRGHTVLGCDLTHQPTEAAFSVHGYAMLPDYARCDVGESRQLRRVFHRFGPFDLVYHCAAEFGRWNGEDFYEDLWRTNVVGTKHLIRLQEEQRFKLVHLSSSEVYGDWPGLMIETVPDVYALHLLNDYAMSKWVNEQQIRNSGTHFGTQSVIVRLFNTYGPGEYYSPYRSVNCRFLYHALHDLPWTVFCGHRRTSTYLEDVGRTLANIADRFLPGQTYNISGETLHSIEELSALVVEVTGADPAKVVYEDNEFLTTKVKQVDTTKAVRELGHKNTVPIYDGLKLTADWMREVYRISR